VTPPYATQPLDALMAAHTSVGLVLGALVWFRRLRPAIANALFAVAIALAVVAPVGSEFLRGVGLMTDLIATPVVTWLKWAVALAVLATLVTRRWWLAGTAMVLGGLLYEVFGVIQDSDGELAGTTLAYLGLLIGLHWRWLPAEVAPASADAGPAEAPAVLRARPAWWQDAWWKDAPEWADDVAAGVLGTVGGAIACRVILHGWTDSGDEWGDTFQAALFAKLRAYGTVPHCSEALRTFWVFQYLGKSFAQYTPGWPYFMAPFVALHVTWLAGPAALGVLAAGIGRLARRAAAGGSRGAVPASKAEVRAAGWLAILVALLSSNLLINGGSRYPHVFVAAMFAWSIEALLAISTTGTPRPERWGAALGGCAALLLAARPGDGACLGLGLFLYFVYAFVRRRVPLRALGAAAATFAFVGGLTLVILRLQLGKWFVTGYSLTEAFYPWAKVAWSMPKPEEYKWGITLATGSYCWWPCSPAAGLAGIAALRGRAQRMGFIFFFGCLPLVAFYTLAEFGRGWAMGYGPRYQLPLLVPMAVGTGVVLGQLWTRATTRATTKATTRASERSPDRSALSAAGPVTLALAAVLLGVVRIAPLVYPYTYADVQTHNRLHEAIAKANLHGAIVFGNAALTDTDPLDLPENLPLELYPDQDVIIAVDHSPDETRCIRRMYPNRRAYRAWPSLPVRLVPEP
jgi:hypothetical protein